MSKRYRHLPALLLWTIFWFAFLGTLLLAIDRLPNSDLSGQFHAFGLFQARELISGQLPLWTPGSYGGIPFAADTQAAVFYPPRWLTILLSGPDSLSFYALELEGLLHIWLAGAATYFLALDITRRRARGSGGAAGNYRQFLRLAPEQWAGLIAAVAFGLGGYLTSYPLLQLAILESIAWLPLILFFLRRGVRPSGAEETTAKAHVPALIIAGVLLGLSALAGHPQTFLHVAYLAAAYYGFLVWQGRWKWRCVFGVGLVIGTVAVGIAAAAMLPALSFLPYTVRSDVSYEFVAKGFPLLHYLQLLVPGPLSVWLPQYVGLVPVFLALLAWLGRKQWPERRQRAETIFWAIVILLAAWLSLGDKGILFELAYRIAPGFSFFRQQERLVGILVLGLALLAAQGWVVWRFAERKRRTAWLRRSAAMMAAGLLLVGIIFLLSRTFLGNSDWLSLWIRQWFILGAVVLVLWTGRSDRGTGGNWWRAPALLLILGLDLFFPIRRAMDLQRESPAVFWPQPAWLAALEGDGVFRIDGQNLFNANIGEIYGLEDVKGISPLKPQWVADFEDLPRHLRWQLLNVRYVLAREPLAEGLVVAEPMTESIMPGEEMEAFVYAFEDALPRAWMVYEAIMAADGGEAFKMMRQEGFDPAREVILTGLPAAELGGVELPDQAPQVQVERLSSSELAFQVETQEPGILVISEWALPGWQATVNGERAPLLRANYALQALYLAAGGHEVLLSRTNQEVQLGLMILLLTLLAAAVLAWRWRPDIPTRPIQSRTAKTEQTIRDWPLGGRALSVISARRVMIVLVLVGFGLRLLLLGNQELRGDEAFSYLFAQLPLAGVIPELVEQGDPHSPLHYLLLNAWVDLAGVSELAMRWLSLVPGVLLIPVLYRLGSAMARRQEGILAAILAVLSPSLIWLAQDVRNQYTLAILLSSLATWLLIGIGKGRAARSREKQGVMWLIYVLLCALAIYSHYYAVFAILGHAAYLWFAPARRRDLVAWILAVTLAALFFLPWLLVVLPELLAAGQLSDPGAPNLANHLVAVGRELIVGATLSGRWTRWLLLGLSAVALSGFLALRKKRPGWAAMLVVWLGGAALGIFLVRFSRSTFNAFYISVAAPAWILLLSAGFGALWDRRGWRRAVAVIGLAAWLLASMMSLGNYYFDPAHSRTLGYRQTAEFLKEEAAEGDIFIAHFPDPALDYYLRDVPMPREMQPARAGQTAAETEASLARLAQENERLWFVPYNKSVWDAENVVPNWLERNTLLEQKLAMGRMELDAYRPLPAAGDVVLPLEGMVNDALRLEGAYVTVDGRPVDFDKPAAVEAGSEIMTSLLWSAGTETPENYTVFVHLLDENGVLVAQHDGLPVEGTRPTATWEAGEQLVDRHSLVVPDGLQGAGKLMMGLYESESLQRQALQPGQDALEIVAIEFK